MGDADEILGLRAALETERARSYAIESRAREVLRTGEETERELATERILLDGARERIAALEADLAAMRGTLEQVRQNVNDLFTSLRHVGAEPDSEACAPANAAIYRIDAALASSPGAATRDTERAAVVADVGECCRGADPACAGGCLVEQALRKRVDPGAAWLATAREVVEALAELVSDDRLQTLTPPWRRARALLARPEVKAWAGR